MSEARLATVVQMQRIDVTPATEDDYVYVGRPSKFGNPYRAGRDGTKEEVCNQYRQHLYSRPDLMAALPTLISKYLVCWCGEGEMCHAKILAEEVNKLAITRQPRTGN